MQKSINYKTLFGPCIMNQYRKQENERYSEKHKIEKLREKELFQIIDDYIEQA